MRRHPMRLTSMRTRRAKTATRPIGLIPFALLDFRAALELRGRPGAFGRAGALDPPPSALDLPRRPAPLRLPSSAIGGRSSLPTAAHPQINHLPPSDYTW